MSAVVRSLLFGLLCLLATPAAAQTGDYGAIGLQIQRNAGHEPMGDPRKTHEVGLCLAMRDQNFAMLRELPHSIRESGYVAGAFTHGNIRCHPEDRVFLIGGRFLRAAMAEYLLSRAGGVPRNLAIFTMPDPAALQALDANIRAPIIFIQIGECAARANPDGIRALLATQVSSPQERAAFGPVVPSIAGCVPGGVTFNLPPLLIRGYLAEGALRNTVAARAGTH